MDIYWRYKVAAGIYVLRWKEDDAVFRSNVVEDETKVHGERIKLDKSKDLRVEDKVALRIFIEAT